MYFKSLDMDKRKKSAPREKDVNIKDFLGWFIQAISIVGKIIALVNKPLMYVRYFFCSACYLQTRMNHQKAFCLIDVLYIVYE